MWFNKNKERFYLVSYHYSGGSGSIWFSYVGFPSHTWIKEAITNAFPDVSSPAIMTIQELSKKDYESFKG